MDHALGANHYKAAMKRVMRAQSQSIVRCICTFEQDGLYPLKWPQGVPPHVTQGYPAMTLPAVGKLTRSLLALLMFVAATTAVAQERARRQGPPAEQQQAAGEGVLRLLPPDSTTQHTIDLPSGKLSYTATAGTLSLFDQSGERSAAIFYTAYVAESAEPAKRPLTFVFNGGPGAAS